MGRTPAGASDSRSLFCGHRTNRWAKNWLKIKSCRKNTTYFIIYLLYAYTYRIFTYATHTHLTYTPRFFNFLVCPAGTFCTLDVCINRLEETSTVDIKGAVEKIRSQRAYSIQTPEQYVFCHLALIEYASARGFLCSPPDLSDLKPLEDSDWSTTAMKIAHRSDKAFIITYIEI